jgi:hypothetical protein
LVKQAKQEAEAKAKEEADWMEKPATAPSTKTEAKAKEEAEAKFIF